MPMVLLIISGRLTHFASQGKLVRNAVNRNIARLVDLCSLSNRKHFHTFIVTRVEVWENEKLQWAH